MSWVFINFPEIPPTCLLPPNPEARSKHKPLRSCHFFLARFCLSPALILPTTLLPHDRPPPPPHTHTPETHTSRLCSALASAPLREQQLSSLYVCVCVCVCRAGMGGCNKKPGATLRLERVIAQSFISADTLTGCDSSLCLIKVDMLMFSQEKRGGGSGRVREAPGSSGG